MSEQNKTRKNAQLIFMVLAFLIPIVAAKILLASNYKGEVKTYGGELLNMDLTYQELVENPSLTRDWQLMYVTNQVCEQNCQEQLYYVTQTYRALGRLQSRIRVGSMMASAMLTSPEFLSDIDFTQQTLKNAATDLEDSVLIIDPLGKLVMRYQLSGSKQQRLKSSHDMLLDIKRLLKLSRIG